MFRKGQVSTEYLVILAVVLVIALVVVYLVGGFSGLGTGSLATVSKNYWGSTSPFAIVNFKSSGSTLTLEVVNNGLSQDTLNTISIDGVAVYSNATVFNSGQDIVLSMPVTPVCTGTGAPFTYNNVVFNYNQGSVTGLAETGAKPLVGTCS